MSLNRRRDRLKLLAAVVLLLGLLLLAANAVVPFVISRLLEAALPRALASYDREAGARTGSGALTVGGAGEAGIPKMKLRVDIGQTSLLDMIRGRLNQVRVRAHNLRLPNAPVFSSVEIELYDVRISPGALTRIGFARVNLVLGQEELNRYLEERLPLTERPAPRVEVEPDLILVTAGKEILGLVKLPLEVEGKLECPDGLQVDFAAERIRVGPVAVSGPAARALAGAVNPLVDLANLPFVSRVDKISLQPGKILIKGRARLVTPIPLRMPYRW